MVKRAAVVGLVLALLLCAGGCSRDEGESVPGRPGGQAGSGTAAREQEGVTAAARSRGVPVETGGGSEEEPRIEVETVDLQWRTAPEKGIQANIVFRNPVDTDLARAKGHVFLIARSAANEEAVGVYPWAAKLAEGYPERYGDGTRISFLDRERLQVFIPFRAEEGYYDSVTLLVYDRNGGLVIEETHSVEPDEGTVSEGEATFVL